MFSKKIPEISPSLGLKQVLEQLKKEIRELQQKAVDEKMFELEEVEIELSLGIKGTVKGEVSVWVISMGAEVSAESLHKVKLKLKPMGSEDKNATNSPDLPRKGGGGGGLSRVLMAP